MKTLYIDVYFLINFTVDLLALYFAALFAKVKSTPRRLIFASLVGAAMACITVLMNLKGIFFIIILLLSSIMISMIFLKCQPLLRHIKLLCAFLIFETFIGGFVTLIYNVFDIYIYPLIEFESIGAENQKLLLISLLLLFAYGILRLLFILFFGTKNESNIDFKIGLLGKEIRATALIDSGNLLCDPMTGKPVIIVKKRIMDTFLGKENIIETNNPDIKSRIRFIPLKSISGDRILTAIRCDYIFLAKTKEKHENIIIALDEEEGNFGGYVALMPVCFSD